MTVMEEAGIKKGIWEYGLESRGTEWLDVVKRVPYLRGSAKWRIAGLFDRMLTYKVGHCFMELLNSYDIALLLT
jgi:hypothetical protein